MEAERTLEKIKDLGLIAVVRGASQKEAVEVSGALVEGGVLGIEIAFTTPGAGEAMEELAERYGEGIVLGAGTVTDEEQIEISVRAGARFLVSPGLDPELARRMQESGLAALPGVLTPSEVMLASRLGFSILKLFPGLLGGPAYLEALRGPFPDISFVPTGGVSEENVAEWFAAGAFAVGVGSSLAPPTLEDRDYERVVQEARRLNEAVHGAQES